MADINITYIWLGAGILFFLLEALGATGVGFMFAGFGALTVGTIINMGGIPSDQLIPQVIAFFAATMAWTALLWPALRRHRQKLSSGYSNMIGDSAFVGSGGLSQRKGGEVTWSGTIMKARLPENSGIEYLEAGAEVIIVSVSGATLTVKPKQ